MNRAAKERGALAGRRIRIRRSRDFQEVLRGGLRRSGAGVTLIVGPNTLGHPRLGLIVSRRTSPRALDRNRFKRIVRECFRLHPERFGDERDYVVIARPRRGRVRSEELCQELCRLAAKIDGAIHAETQRRPDARRGEKGLRR